MTMEKKRLFGCAMVALAFACTSTALAIPSNVLAVDEDASAGGDGTSWNTAFRFLQDALDVADDPTSTIDEIWVAEGRYKPDEDANNPNGTGDQSASFELLDNVRIYGGLVTFDRDHRSRGSTAWYGRVCLIGWLARVAERSCDEPVCDRRLNGSAANAMTE